MIDEVIIEQVTPPPQTSAVAWGAVIAGTVVALGTGLIFAALGAGFAAGSLAAWPNAGHNLTHFSAMTGAWIIIGQWMSIGLGAYLTGRLRTRWHGLHTHEVFFRDTANGLVTWAVATVVVAGLGAVTTSLGAPDAALAAQTLTPDAAQAAAKAAAGFSIFTAVSLLVGAFVACIAAALGGQERDKHA